MCKNNNGTIERNDPTSNTITNNNSGATDTAIRARPSIQDIVNKESWYKSPLVILVVGASGDLAKKKTYPALFSLWKERLLPSDTVIYGFARSVRTHEEIRASLRPYLLQSTDAAALVDDFLRLCWYRPGKSYGDAPVVTSILRETNAGSSSNLLVYLAIPPHVFGDATQAVKTALQTLPKTTTASGFTRIVLEKPFGRDTESCRALLNVLKEQEWEEQDLYRIDHYLGKDIVQNIVPLRQHNPWLSAIWNKNVVQAVHILFKEPFGTEGRGGYFDPYGIIRDILQNHLMQVLTLIAMDLPTGDLSAAKIRDAKVNVLKSMPVIEARDCLLGQYDGYKEDETIENHNTTTPTYACIRTWVNTDTWRGVPFIMEAGKALDERLCEARLHFRGNNVLVLRLQPEPTVYFTTNVKEPGFSESPMATHLGINNYNKTIDSHGPLPEAYTKLVLDALRGRQGNFVRDDELIAAWSIFTPCLREHETVPPAAYSHGSTGPVERAIFLNAMGVGVESLSLPSSSL